MKDSELGKKLLFFTWNVIMSNLYNPRHIKEEETNDIIHGSWLLRKNFVADNIDGYKEGYILERIDPDIYICKENVRWVKEEDAVNSLTSNFHEPTFLREQSTIYTIDKKTGKKKVSKKLGLYNCFCGNTFSASIYDVNHGKINSCGCLRSFHNIGKHPLYSIWYDMIRRCYDPSRKDYKHYGGRGIDVSEEWWHAGNFIKTMGQSYINGYTLDRINVDKGYSKQNCRWATKSTQARNTVRLRSDNSSGFRGVRKHSKNNSWVATVTINNKQHYLGSYTDPKDAAFAYDKFVIDHKLEHTTNGLYRRTDNDVIENTLKTHDAEKALDFMWKVMASLHHNPLRKDTAYKTYGVCGRWLIKKNFINDLKHGYKQGYTIKRINDNEFYSMTNIKWVKIEDGGTLLDEYKEPELIKDLSLTEKTDKGLYKCFCGNTYKARKKSVVHKDSKSCGCLNNLHNIGSLKFYKTWSNMLNRVYANDNSNVEEVCDRWLNIRTFNEDISPTYKDNLIFTRIDDTKDYCVDNFKWATKSEVAQARF